MAIKINKDITQKVLLEQREKLARLELDYGFLTTIGAGAPKAVRLHEIEQDIVLTKQFILFLEEMLNG